MIQGNDCIFQIDLGAGYLPILCGKSFTLTLTTEIVETTTKGDGRFQDFDYNTLSYTISMEGLVKLESIETFDVLLAQKNFLDVPFQLIYQDGSAYRMIQGTVIITNTELTAAAGESAAFSHEFKGRGSFVMYDTLTPCLTYIGTGLLDVTIGSNAPLSDDTIVSINTVTGSWAYFKYSLDGGAEVTEYTTEFLIGVLAEGAHSITITPYCDTDIAGTGVTLSFTVAAAPPAPCLAELTNLSYYLSHDPLSTNVYTFFMYTPTAGMTAIQYSVDLTVNDYSISPIPLIGLYLTAGFNANVVFRGMCDGGVQGLVTTILTSVPALSSYSPTNNSSLFNHRDTATTYSLTIDGVFVQSGTVGAYGRIDFNYTGTNTSTAIDLTLGNPATTSTYRVVSKGAFTGTTASINPSFPNTLSITGANIDNGFLIAIW